ncbi:MULTISPECIES: hypothetical protein [Actinomadura]|uniref:Uncharacterized protein n=1 Tax=Actinomadura madurae TaxID=1993 RepID=A0A1I5RDK1_9ACTN|nr:hypothetical protein [Actinomadura madurae]SFP56460.1 hypothetical protein SAMN04489713_11577 [Actinomadura madurae]SPT59320.1 Uncharacterised protein [Actinomadura madurae]
MSRKRRVLITGVALLGAAGAIGTGSAMAQDNGARAPKEAHVTGDAWVTFPGDKEYPYRRFIVDAHGGPWKFVDGKMVMGAARGTVKFDHFSPDEPGGPSQHHWGEIKVDYVMASGPVAVVSGIRVSGAHEVPPNQKRANLTFYQSPRGHKHDRMGFSWGVVFPQCQQMGSGPAPFSPASSGPFGKWLKGYTVKDAPLEIPSGGFQPPDFPPDCSFADE